MDQEDREDLAKRSAHLAYLLDLSILYANLRGRKHAHEDLKSQLTDLELHIANELKEFLNNG